MILNWTVGFCVLFYVCTLTKNDNGKWLQVVQLKNIFDNGKKTFGKHLFNNCLQFSQLYNKLNKSQK